MTIPICVKSKPDQRYVTIDLTMTTECLPPISEWVHYKEEPQDESYDEVETDLEGYLSNEKLVPMEMNSPDAEEFKDQPRITSHPPDVKGLQSTLLKLSCSFQLAAGAYNELATYLPTLPVEDVVPLMKALPEPDSTKHRPLARAMREHGEKYIMGLVIRKQTKQGKNLPDLERMYGVTCDYIYQARHGHPR